MSSAAPTERARLLDPAFRLAFWFAYRVLLVWWFVFRPQGRGVFIAVWHDGRVLAIRNSYRRGLALPAGGIQRGETLHDAALRELREEVGISAPPEALRFVREIPSDSEWKRNRCTFFELHLETPVEPHPDRREVVWAGFIRPAEALRADVFPAVRVYLEARMSERS